MAKSDVLTDTERTIELSISGARVTLETFLMRRRVKLG